MARNEQSYGQLLKLAMRLLGRGSGARSVVMLVLALCVSVATVGTLTLTTDRLAKLIYTQATHFLAADAKLSGAMPFENTWTEKANELGLAHSETTYFRAMLFGPEDQSADSAMKMGAVKAVDDNYPLKGQLLIADRPYGEPVAVTHGPGPGEIWLTSRLFSGLNMNVGDTLTLGEVELRASKAIIQEPDNPQSALGFAPRVMIHQSDIASTGAIAVGSRVNYSLLLAGEAAAIGAFEDYILDAKNEHYRWQQAGEGEGADAGVFERISQYVLLVGAMALILGAAAIALAATQYTQRQAKTVAVLKTLGLGPRSVRRLLILQMLVLASIGALSGLILAWLLHTGLMAIIQEIIPQTLPMAGVLAFVMPLVAGGLVLAAFAGPRFWQLQNITPKAAFNAVHQASLRAQWWLAGAVLVVLIMVLTQQWLLSLGVLMALALVFFAVRFLVLASSPLLNRWHNSAKGAVRLGLGQWLNFKQVNATQVSVFALIFLVLFTVFSARTVLLETWQQQVPEDAPNHFVFNIFDHQKTEISKFITANATNASAFYPMTRGRVVAVNDLEWKEQLAQSPNAQDRNYERELNLTWSQTLQDDNTVVAGKWWQGDEQELLVSIEQSYAEGANLQVGDTVTLSLAGQQVDARLASIRTLNWQSMRPNFFIIFNQKPHDFVASNWITSFYLTPDKKPVINDLVQTFPSISLVEVDQTLAAIKLLVQQLGFAVEYLLALIAMAAAIVLVTNIYITLPERKRLAALNRVFGAPKVLLVKALWTEFILLGSFAGLLACLGTELLTRFWLAPALKIEQLGFLPMWFWGAPLAVLVLSLMARFASRDVLNTSPVRLLRSV